MTRTKKIVLLAIFLSLSIVLSYIERFIPMPGGIPGVKLGLANIAIIICLYLLGFGPAISLSILRCVFVSLLWTGLSTLPYSLAGSIASILLMYLLKRYFSKQFSIIGISIFGAIVHNIAQLSTAVFLLRENALWTYLPFLLVAASISGLITGILSNQTIKRMKFVK